MIPEKFACKACNSQNFYLAIDWYTCRDCGEKTGIDPVAWDLLPNISEVKKAIWEKVNQDLERLEQLKTEFGFEYAVTPQRIYMKFFNILQRLTWGKGYTSPTPVPPPAGPIYYDITTSGSKDAIYRLSLAPGQPPVPRGLQAVYVGEPKAYDKYYRVKKRDTGTVKLIKGRQYLFYPKSWRGYCLEVHENDLDIKYPKPKTPAKKEQLTKKLAV